MQELIAQWGAIHHLQRDGGSEFEASCEHYLKSQVRELRTSRPYKKNDQAFIEKFNATLRKECVGHLTYKKEEKQALQKQVDQWLEYYHSKRPHMSLSMLTPQEFINKHSMSHLT